MISSIQSLLRVWVSRVIGAGAAYQGPYDDHAAVLHAVRIHDPEAEAVAMGAHMNTPSTRLLKTIRTDYPDGGRELVFKAMRGESPPA